MSGIQSVKVFGGGKFAGHVGVVEMAMGVDEAGQQNDFAEVEDFCRRLPISNPPKGRRRGCDFRK